MNFVAWVGLSCVLMRNSLVSHPADSYRPPFMSVCIGSFYMAWFLEI